MSLGSSTMDTSRRHPRWLRARTPRTVPVEQPAAGAEWLRLGPPHTVTATARPLDWPCQRLPTLPSSRSRRRRLQTGSGVSLSGSWRLRVGLHPTFTATPRPHDRHCGRLPTPPSPLWTQPPPGAADNGSLAADARPTGASCLLTRLTARDGCLGLWPLTRGTCRVFAASAKAQVRRAAGSTGMHLAEACVRIVAAVLGALLVAKARLDGGWAALFCRRRPCRRTILPSSSS